jgi:hypothetical protein
MSNTKLNAGLQILELYTIHRNDIDGSTHVVETCGGVLKHNLEKLRQLGWNVISDHKFKYIEKKEPSFDDPSDVVDIDLFMDGRTVV